MISVIKYPTYIASVYRPVVFDVKSNVISRPEFQIKAILYVKVGNIFKQVAIKYTGFYNNQNFCRFNFSKQLQSFITYDIYDSDANEIISPNFNSITSYFVEFQEMYNDANGNMQGFWIGKTTIHYAANATLQHTQTQNLDPWTILNGAIENHGFTQIGGTSISENIAEVVRVPKRVTFIFPKGNEEEVSFTVQNNNAGYFTAVTKINISGYSVFINNKSVSLPFTFTVGNLVNIKILRNTESESKLILNG